MSNMVRVAMQQLLRSVRHREMHELEKISFSIVKVAILDSEPLFSMSVSFQSACEMRQQKFKV
jgi:hypothetical protein